MSYPPNTISSSIKPVVLLWVEASLGMVWPFQREYISCIPCVSCKSDICIMIYNSTKIQLRSRNKIILKLGLLTTWRTILKGCSIRKVENHWTKWIKKAKCWEQYSKSLIMAILASLGLLWSANICTEQWAQKSKTSLSAYRYFLQQLVLWHMWWLTALI